MLIHYFIMRYIDSGIFMEGLSLESISHMVMIYRSIFSTDRVKKACFKTLVDEVQELEALSKDPGAVVHGKRYSYTPLHHCRRYSIS